MWYHEIQNYNRKIFRFRQHLYEFAEKQIEEAKNPIF